MSRVGKEIKISLLAVEISSSVTKPGNESKLFLRVKILLSSKSFLFSPEERILFPFLSWFRTLRTKFSLGSAAVLLVISRQQIKPIRRQKGSRKGRKIGYQEVGGGVSSHTG